MTNEQDDDVNVYPNGFPKPTDKFVIFAQGGDEEESLSRTAPSILNELEQLAPEWAEFVDEIVSSMSFPLATMVTENRFDVWQEMARTAVSIPILVAMKATSVQAATGIKPDIELGIATGVSPEHVVEAGDALRREGVGITAPLGDAASRPHDAIEIVGELTKFVSFTIEQQLNEDEISAGAIGISAEAIVSLVYMTMMKAISIAADNEQTRELFVEEEEID